MNKSINIFSAIVVVIYCFFAMSVIYDLSFSSLSFKSVPYQEEICTALSFLLLILGILRAKRRWQGLKDMIRFKQFKFVIPVAKSRMNLGRIFTIVEIVFMGGFLYLLSRLAALSLDLTFPMIVVIGILMIESTLFLVRTLKAGNGFKIGIDKKLVAYFDREIYIFYFSGLRRVELHQDLINFQYKGELNLFLPLDAIEKNDLIPFRDNLIKTLEAESNKNIYIDNDFRRLE